MRHAAYILTLIVIWAAGMAALMLGLNDLLFRGRLPGWFLFGGAQLAAFAVVSLAEEVAEAVTLRKSRSSLPARLMAERLRSRIDCDPTLLAELHRQPRN